MPRMDTTSERSSAGGKRQASHVHDVGRTAWLLSHTATPLRDTSSHDAATPLAMPVPTQPGLLRAPGMAHVGLLPALVSHREPPRSGGSGDRGVPGQTSGVSPS